jgi:hypothetical protein
MLHMFHTYIASVLSGCHVCFTMVFQVFRMYVLNVSSAFTASIVSRCFKYRSSVASPSSLSAASHQFLLLLLKLARHSPPPPLLDAGGVRDGAGPAWTRETGRETNCRCERLDTSNPDSRDVSHSHRVFSSLNHAIDENMVPYHNHKY